MIELNNIKKNYSSDRGIVNALSGISLKIHKGEFLALMGKSGCGKSTLLNIIGCLDNASEGDYYLNSQNVAELTKKQKAYVRSHTFGFVFQSFYLIPEYTVLENVMLPLKYNNTPNKEHSQTAWHMLEALGIESLSKEKPNVLSGGEQQRVAIARAMVGSPDVLLCDEPTGNLDTSTSKVIMQLLCDLHKNMKRTIIVVTHDVKVARHAEKIIELQDGTIVSNITQEGILQC